jgi:hypothetical protein
MSAPLATACFANATGSSACAVSLTASGNLRYRAHLTHVVAYHLESRDLPDGRCLPPVRGTEIQLDPAQPGRFHLTGDVRNGRWSSDSDAAGHVRIFACGHIDRVPPVISAIL